MRVLVFGRSGWLASRYAAYFQAQLSHVDVRHLGSVRVALDFAQPELVINAAGKTHSVDVPNIDACVATPRARAETCEVNALGAGVVATACAERGVKLVHLASGCVFDGEDQIFDETAQPNPVSWYAQTKALGDQLVQGIDPTALILRLRMPISAEPHPRNLLTKLAQAKAIVDVTNSVTVVEDLLDWTQALVQVGVCGVVHAVHSQPVSFRTLMEWYRELVDPSQTNAWIPKAAYRTRDGRSNCTLSTRPLPVPFADTELAVKRALRAYASVLSVV